MQQLDDHPCLEVACPCKPLLEIHEGCSGGEHDPPKDTMTATLGVARSGQVILSCREAHLAAGAKHIMMAILLTASAPPRSATR